MSGDHHGRTVNIVDDPPPGRHRVGWFKPALDADVSVHVFTVSAGLVGVCLTVIGIIRISINLQPGYSTIADEVLAGDSFCFMAACLLAYTSLRASSRIRAKRFEAHADRLFILGMAIMCFACGLIAFSFL
jgi:hypothetical protein